MLSRPKAISNALPAPTPAQMARAASITIQTTVTASRRTASRNGDGMCAVAEFTGQERPQAVGGYSAPGSAPEFATVRHGFAQQPLTIMGGRHFSRENPR